MLREARPHAGDAIADLEIRDAFAQSDDFARVLVAERHHLRRLQTLVNACFLRLPKLRSGADERRMHFDEHMAFFQLRHGLGDDTAVPRVVQCANQSLVQHVHSL